MQVEIYACRDLAEEGVYFKKDGVIELFRKNKDGMYVSSRDGSEREEIESYLDINEEVLEDLMKVELKLTFLNEQLDYKLENGQIQMFD